MRHIPQAEVFFDSLNGSDVLSSEGSVDMGNHGLHIGRTIRGHVQANGFEVLPEISGGGWLSESTTTRENRTYKIASTTPEDAYPAKKSPGLLLVISVNAAVDVMHPT